MKGEIKAENNPVFSAGFSGRPGFSGFPGQKGGSDNED